MLGFPVCYLQSDSGYGPIKTTLVLYYHCFFKLCILYNCGAVFIHIWVWFNLMSTLNLLSVVFSFAYFLINKELFEWKITHLVFWWIEGFECSVILTFRGHFFRNIYHLLTETLYIKKVFFLFKTSAYCQKDEYSVAK